MLKRNKVLNAFDMQNCFEFIAEMIKKMDHKYLMFNVAINNIFG